MCWLLDMMALMVGMTVGIEGEAIMTLGYGRMVLL
jgi:hypothetical protein